jgi:hypothetical protein
MVNGELTKARGEGTTEVSEGTLIVCSWRWRRYAVAFALVVFVATFLLSAELLVIDGHSSGIVRTLSGIAGGVILAVGWVLCLFVLGWIWRRPAIRVVAQAVTVSNWRRVRTALSDLGAVTWVDRTGGSFDGAGGFPAWCSRTAPWST